MTIDDWTRWGDAHPWIAGILQLGIYALCWVGWVAGFCLIVALLGLVF
jgi:hypothetical protein